MTSKVGDIVTDTEKVLDSLKLTVQTEKKTKSVDDVSHEKMEDFVESHKSTADQRNDTRGKSTDDAIPFGFSTTQKEWQQSQKMEQFTSEARHFTATAASSAVNAATQAATTAASTASLGFEAATREASKQFKVVTEAIQAPLAPKQQTKKQKTRPVGNFKQKVGGFFSFRANYIYNVFYFRNMMLILSLD